MSTHLSRKEGFSGLWEQMTIRVNQQFYDVTLEKLQRANKPLVKELRKAYGVFFLQIANTVFDRYNGSRGRQIKEAGWGSWPKLSTAWLELKKLNGGSSNFYSGVSGIEGRVKNKRDGTRPGVKATEHLASYMASLKEVDVEDALGPLLFQYTFRTDRKKFTTTKLDSLKDLAGILSPVKGILPSNLLITAEVLAFQDIKGFKQSEWDIVDHIAKQLGDVEQWRKINATRWGRNGRPVRAVVGPRITWYMNTIALPALKKFTESLS